MGVTKSEILLAKLNNFFRWINPKNPKNIFSLIYVSYRTYENYKGVLLNIVRGKYPFQARLRDGRNVEISNRFAAYIYAVYFSNLHIIKLADDVLEFMFNGRKGMLFFMTGKKEMFWHPLFFTSTIFWM
ncbi:hypothetical protein [Stygiolobus azoricus]|uniref:hypothetical protein n=1 Tax=Stygiolobus azoricus TaxID=41675 RepID=UPI001E3D2222|nr:hypothetical protein [Stygiolobus azoricus]